MTTIGLVVDGTDVFLRPIETALRQTHQVDRFAPRFVRLPLIGTRVKEWRLHRQLRQFLERHDVTFFEWAGYVLEKAPRVDAAGGMAKELQGVCASSAMSSKVRRTITNGFDPDDFAQGLSERQVRPSLAQEEGSACVDGDENPPEAAAST